MSRRRSRCWRGRFESLEPRQLLAGDVLVSVVAGQLVIEGDELGNQIAITAGPEVGSFVVRGLEGTNVILQPPMDPAEPQPEGEPGSSVLVHGVSAGVRIGMGDGDDRVVLQDARFHGNVSIGMGNGDDHVDVAPLPPALPEPDPQAGQLSGGPVPQVLQASVEIGGSLAIHTGEGNDAVRIGRTAIRGALRIETASGNDSVVLVSPTTLPPAAPAAIAGQQEPSPTIPGPNLSVGRRIAIHLGEGDDALMAGGIRTAGGLLVDGGQGDDRIGVRESRVGRALTILGGGGEGADQVVVDRVSAGLAAIHTGAGGDHVRIVDSLFHLLGVSLDAGNDTLVVERNAAELAILLGGEGEDTLLGLPHNRFRRQFVHGFELREAPADPVPMETAGRGPTRLS